MSILICFCHVIPTVLFASKNGLAGPMVNFKNDWFVADKVTGG